MTQNKAS